MASPESDEEFTVRLERRGWLSWYWSVSRNRPYALLQSGYTWGKERARRKAAKVTAHPDRFYSEVSL